MAHKWIGHVAVYDPLVEERVIKVADDTLLGWYKEFVNVMSVLEDLGQAGDVMRVFCRRAYDPQDEDDA